MKKQKKKIQKNSYETLIIRITNQIFMFLKEILFSTYRYQLISVPVYTIDLKSLKRY